MKSNQTKTWLTRTTVLASFAGALLAPISYAQDTVDPATAEEDALQDTIVVTGTRIPRIDLTGASPVAVFDSETITQSGLSNVGQFLREIPSVAGAAQTTAVNNGGDGSQRISLRGLGSERTLVLINGRRVVGSGQGSSSGGVSGTVDLTTIPVSMVERIEVLKDGASAVYGSDAVAGVVNVILRTDFDGLEIAGQYGVSSESDGDTEVLSMTFGRNFEGGNFIFNATKTVEDPIGAGDRSFSDTETDLLFGDIFPLGSSAPPWGRYVTSTDILTLGPEYGALRAYTNADSYNFAPSNFARQATERWNVNFSGNMDLDFLTDIGIFETTNAFVTFSYNNRESNQKLAEVPLAPLAFFGFNAPYSADNAYNPTGEDITDWRRRFVEGGSRTEAVDQDTLNLNFGLEGEFAGGWLWDAVYSYGENEASFQFGPIFNLNNVALAVGPTALDGDGAIACDTNGDGAITDADDASCVPLNTFGENSITQDMIDYIAIVANESGAQTLESYAFNLAKGELFNLPGGPVGLALGAEYREVTGFDRPDSQVVALGSAATGTPREPTSGGYDVTEVYAETNLPVFSMLDLDLAIRWSDYSNFGDTTNWKVGARFKPHEDFLLRATASTAFRAPSIGDLFGGQSFSFPSVGDPCSANPTQFCIDDGVPAAGFTPISQQVRSVVGGSPTVQPEEADILTAGFVYQPSFLQGFAVTVDYYDIEVTDAISTIGAGTILSQCAASGTFCDLIDRFPAGDPNVGNPLLIRNTTTNVGGVESAGFDFLIEYKDIETGFGTWGVRWDATYTDKYDKEIADGSVIPHAGFFRDDDDGYFTELRWTLGFDWEIGAFSASADIRHIGSATEFDDDFAGGCASVADDGSVSIDIPAVFPGLTCVDDPNAAEFGLFEHEIESRTYLDIFVDYDFELGSSSNNVFFGINNVADEQPPLSFDAFNDNTDVRTFDTVGRYYYAGFRTKF